MYYAHGVHAHVAPPDGADDVAVPGCELVGGVVCDRDVVVEWNVECRLRRICAEAARARAGEDSGYCSFGGAGGGADGGDGGLRECGNGRWL